MSLETRITALAQAIGLDIKGLLISVTALGVAPQVGSLQCSVGSPFARHHAVYLMALPGCIASSSVVVSLSAPSDNFLTSAEFIEGWTVVAEPKTDEVIFHVFAPHFIDTDFQINYVKV